MESVSESLRKGANPTKWPRVWGTAQSRSCILSPFDSFQLDRGMQHCTRGCSILVHHGKVKLRVRFLLKRNPFIIKPCSLEVGPTSPFGVRSRWRGFSNQWSHKQLAFLLASLHTNQKRVRHFEKHVEGAEDGPGLTPLANQVCSCQGGRRKIFLGDLGQKGSLTCSTV